MEVAGTAIGVLGLLGLYSTCIETLDTLSTAARYGVDREILQTKIEVEKVRLMIWGDSLGLTDIEFDPSKKTEADLTVDDIEVLDESLQRPALRAAISGLLACFVQTFEDVEALQKRYGLVSSESESDGPDEVAVTGEKLPARDILLATFRKTYSSFQDRKVISQRKANPLSKSRWAIADEKKFRELIAELKAINDSLTSLLPAIRNKTRVRMRAEIMQSNDVDQLQNLVSAADDVANLIAETASLRIEMLSTTKGQGLLRKPSPRVVHVSASSVSQALIAEQPLVPISQSRRQAPLPIPAQNTPLPVAQPVSPPIPQQQQQPPAQPYNDSGSLVIHKVTSKPDSLSCYSWLSGIGEVPELNEIQPPAHPAFAPRHIPDPILSVANNLVEIDVECDPRYGGWSPGSTSLTGFAREVTFWQQLGKTEDRKEPHWIRTADRPSITSEFLIARWKGLAQDGLGRDWTERKGYDQVRGLIGPSEFTWLDPNEGFKIRHQITDILACMSTSVVPSLERTASIGLTVNYDKIDPNGGFSFVDFLLQLVEARELLLRIEHERTKRSWYGGITVRIVYDLIAAELWKNNLSLKAGDSILFEAKREVKERQLAGITKFVQEMRWPYANEVGDSVAVLLGDKAADVIIDTRSWDWISGLLLPGGMFPMAIVGAVYNLSPTLKTQLPGKTIQMRKGNYGIVYPQASYWSSRSILGKVLAPLTGIINSLAGWVGPCPSPSLPESTFGMMAELKARPPTFAVGETNAEEDGARTFLPTSESKRGNTVEWTVPVPPSPSSDSAELQTLRLTKVLEPTAESQETGVVGDASASSYQARLDFRLTRSKTIVTFTLYANSIFIAVPPCRGTHRVDPRATSNYTFRTLGIEDLAHAELVASQGDSPAMTVINATGGGGAEAIARAWCSQKGINAAIWDLQKGRCCFKCALMVASKDGLSTGVLITC